MYKIYPLRYYALTDVSAPSRGSEFKIVASLDIQWNVKTRTKKLSDIQWMEY